MRLRFADLIRRPKQEAEGYSRALQAARLRAAYQRSYFAPALFSLIPVETDLIGSIGGCITTMLGWRGTPSRRTRRCSFTK